MVVELVAARVAVPLGGVELDALQVHPLCVAAQLAQARLAVARVVGVVVGQLVGMALRQAERLLGLSEPVDVEVAQQGGLEDGVVDVSVDEQVAHQPFAAVVGVGVVVPHHLFGD